MSPRRVLLPALLALGLLLAACSGDDDDTAATTSTVATSTAPAPTSTSTSAPSATTEPATAWSLDARLDQMVGWLNGEPFDEEHFDEGFGETFRQQITYEELARIGGTFVASGPWAIVSDDRSDDGYGLVARLTPADGSDELQVTLVVGPDDEARIEGLFFRPVVDVEPAADIDGAIDDLTGLGQVTVGAFDVTGGRCGTPLVDRGADVQAPIGSAFKLWVLAAVVDAVDQGSIGWDDDVTIEDRFDSLPTGITQDDPEGSTVSVRTLAERMISISDNTATDVLVDLVGRDAVEAAFVDTSHSAPELNRPLLTTREFFVLKLDAELRARFLTADETGRRDLLAGPVADVDLTALTARAVGEWTAPVEVEAVEWFASPTDLCRVLTSLAGDADARGVLSINPGLPDEAGRWSFIGYKGGSEPGALTMSWFVEDAEGTAYVVAGSVWDPEALLDETTVTVRLGEVRDLIGR